MVSGRRPARRAAARRAAARRAAAKTDQHRCACTAPRDGRRRLAERTRQHKLHRACSLGQRAHSAAGGCRTSAATHSTGTVSAGVRAQRRATDSGVCPDAPGCALRLHTQGGEGGRDRRDDPGVHASRPRRRTEASKNSEAALPTVQDAGRARGRVLLNCPYAEKEVAKSHGAKWDRAQRTWYIEAGTTLAPFAAWLPARPGFARPVSALPVGCWVKAQAPISNKGQEGLGQEHTIAVGSLGQVLDIDDICAVIVFQGIDRRLCFPASALDSLSIVPSPGEGLHAVRGQAGAASVGWGSAGGVGPVPLGGGALGGASPAGMMMGRLVDADGRLWSPSSTLGSL